eukprot:scaffold3743_cov389-Prasinococcus_capsulatus_cf.AAC.15
MASPAAALGASTLAVTACSKSFLRGTGARRAFLGGACVRVPTRRSIAVRPAPSLSRRASSGCRRTVRAVAPPPEADEVDLEVDNVSDGEYTVINIQTRLKPGLLQAIISTFRDLDIDVVRAEIDTTDGSLHDKFFVLRVDGQKLTETECETLETCLTTVLRYAVDTKQMRTVVAQDSEAKESRKQLLFSLMDTYIKSDVLSIQQSIVNHVEYTIGRQRYRFDDFDCYQATSMSMRDRLIERWNDTHQHFNNEDPKRVYYLSMEFLMGRTLLNSMMNFGLEDRYSLALQQLGYSMEVVAEEERDAALGNGGLGRLAACFLDSLATLNYPAWGYGIRYQYGMFRQSIQDGFQHEQPDYWLNFGNPWEIERHHIRYPVNFYGHVETYDDDGRLRFQWIPGDMVEAVAYDNPIPGFKTGNTINLRLWGAKPAAEFDLQSFNTGDYVSAILSKQRAETLSSVLYPDDRTYQGKELRLKQQHFFVTASLQDMIRRFKETHTEFDDFPKQVAIQLNDTHPTIAIPELMRLLMDENGLGWTQAWQIATQVFSFTNHTVLPEALEKWPVDLIETLLPRHMQIIYDINWRFLQELRERFGDDWTRISRMSIIDESEGGKQVRMATLALVGSKAVNGVAKIHSELIKETIFKDFYELWPHKFQNKTNGVTQRRWLAFCNLGLSELITRTLATEMWKTELDLLAGLRDHAEDPSFRQQWWSVKQANKARVAQYIETVCGVKCNPDALFDIQVKRIHEYKRQLLNVLSVIYRYDAIKNMTPEEKGTVVPRVVIIGGKAAPGYEAAKRIIKLIGAVGDTINNDPDVGDLLKLVFVPDYNVSVAELIVPGSELSQHISTAGTEASGTSNMKFAMNGCLIIGTLDGANVEIAEEVGKANMFIFGALANEVPRLRANVASRKTDDRFYHVLNLIRSGTFGWADYFSTLIQSLDTSDGGDYYLLGHDFEDYLRAQQEVVT